MKAGFYNVYLFLGKVGELATINKAMGMCCRVRTSFCKLTCRESVLCIYPHISIGSIIMPVIENVPASGSESASQDSLLCHASGMCHTRGRKVQ